jgi:hypothetical protein
MRKVYSIFITVLLTASMFAQLPQKMSYQSVIRNSSNQLVTSHAVGMSVSILQGSATGTAVYVETQTPTTNANGLVTIEIGGGTPVTGTFSGIDWSTGTYFIKTEIDPSGNTSYTITGTSQLLSVPYALYSKASASSVDAVKLAGDQTISGNKTFSGTTTVITPVNATDASTKAYVDELSKKVQDLNKFVFSQFPPPTNGLVAYFPFNGNANDESGNGYNGTVVGASLTTNRFDVANSAYSFAGGTTSYIQTPISNFFTQNFTICAWAKCTDNVNASSIIASRNALDRITGFGFDENNLYFYVSHSIGSANSNYPTGTELNLIDNRWHFYCAVYNSGTLSLFVDNILRGQTVSSTPVVIVAQFKIGLDDLIYNGQLRGFKGSIDDVRFYNRVMSTNEVQQLYHEGGW